MGCTHCGAFVVACKRFVPSLHGALWDWVSVGSYVFVTADKQKLAEYKKIAQQLSGLGLGELRIHTAGRVGCPFAVDSIPSPE